MSKTTTHNTEVRKVTAVREPSGELSADELAQVTGGITIKQKVTDCPMSEH